MLLLDTRNNVMGQRVIYQGNVKSSVVRPAEVFRDAIIESAPNIIVAHNHPGGDPTPSPEDVSITQELTAAGKLLGINLMDHLVIGGDRFVSLKGTGADGRIKPLRGERGARMPSTDAKRKKEKT